MKDPLTYNGEMWWLSSYFQKCRVGEDFVVLLSRSQLGPDYPERRNEQYQYCTFRAVSKLLVSTANLSISLTLGKALNSIIDVFK